MGSRLTTETGGLPRLLAIMGSGETAPTMSKVHRDLLARLGRGPSGPLSGAAAPVSAVFLDTPFGFQANADDLVARTVDYFRESVQADITAAPFRSARDTGSLGYETMLNAIRDAHYVFAGPGSPSYALRQWRETQVPVVLADKLATGGCVTFASAAAVTLGRFALPVYEIYKVGQDPHWLEGLDLMGSLDLPAVVIPHFDNAEGGTHDTRYCYMGEARLRVLEAMLPDEAFVLGVDEHTACVIDLDDRTVAVAGRGTVTVRRGGRTAGFGAGETVALDDLATLAGAGAAPPPAARPVTPVTEAEAESPAARSPLLEEVARLRSEFEAALAGADAHGAVNAILDIDDLIRQWSRDTLQSDELDQARSALRSMVVRLGQAAEAGLRDPNQVVGPFVDALLAARARARDDKRWADADVLRDRLVEIGVDVHDAPDGTTWELR